MLLWTSFITEPSTNRHRSSAMPRSLQNYYRHLRVTRTRLSRLPRHYHLHRRYKRRRFDRPPRHSCHYLSSPSCYCQRYRSHHIRRHSPSPSSLSSNWLQIQPIFDCLGPFSPILDITAYSRRMPIHSTPLSERSPHYLYPPYPLRDLESMIQRVDFLQMHRIGSISVVTPSEQHLLGTIHAELSSLHHLLYTCESTISLSPSQVFLSQGTKQATLPTVIDSGASMSLSPIRSDFVTFRECSTTISGVSAKAQVQGTGTVRWRIVDQHGVDCTIETEAYYVPDAGIRLYSPKYHFQEHSSGCLLLTHDECVLQVPRSNQTMSFPCGTFGT